MNILMEEKNMKLRGGEKSKYTALKDRTFSLTSVYDSRLMRESGMDTEFLLIFAEMGWENFRTIEEPGCKLLTTEFLCTLQLFNNGITFRMFTKEFSLTWKELSQYLGFQDDCVLNVDSVMPEFERTQF
jgi:hypothetical protein